MLLPSQWLKSYYGGRAVNGASSTVFAFRTLDIRLESLDSDGLGFVEVVQSLLADLVQHRLCKFHITRSIFEDLEGVFVDLLVHVITSALEIGRFPG